MRVMKIPDTLETRAAFNAVQALRPVLQSPQAQKLLRAKCSLALQVWAIRQTGSRLENVLDAGFWDFLQLVVLSLARLLTLKPTATYRDALGIIEQVPLSFPPSVPADGGLLPHRKRVTLQHEVARQQRSWARAASRLEPGTLDPEVEDAIEWAQRLHAALAERRANREAESQIVRDGDGTPQSEDLGATIATLRERAWVRLRELATTTSSKKFGAQARRSLARYEKPLLVRNEAPPA